ncbi:unnamed protein product [Amoebophrya sp. A120]|nr:unnamed protein product [Amoebophrya sp. A120]|eukprot:GSA120T00005575001.1
MADDEVGLPEPPLEVPEGAAAADVEEQASPLLSPVLPHPDSEEGHHGVVPEADLTDKPVEDNTLHYSAVEEVSLLADEDGEQEQDRAEPESFAFSDAVSEDEDAAQQHLRRNLASDGKTNLNATSNLVDVDDSFEIRGVLSGAVPAGPFETSVSDFSSDGFPDSASGGAAPKRRKLLLEHETPHNVNAERFSYPVFDRRELYHAGNNGSGLENKHQICSFVNEDRDGDDADIDDDLEDFGLDRESDQAQSLPSSANASRTKLISDPIVKSAGRAASSSSSKGTAEKPGCGAEGVGQEFAATVAEGIKQPAFSPVPAGADGGLSRQRSGEHARLSKCEREKGIANNSARISAVSPISYRSNAPSAASRGSNLADQEILNSIGGRSGADYVARESRSGEVEVGGSGPSRSSKRARSVDQEFALDTHNHKQFKSGDSGNPAATAENEQEQDLDKTKYGATDSDGHEGEKKPAPAATSSASTAPAAVVENAVANLNASSVDDYETPLFGPDPNDMYGFALAPKAKSKIGRQSSKAALERSGLADYPGVSAGGDAQEMADITPSSMAMLKEQLKSVAETGRVVSPEKVLAEKQAKSKNSSAESEPGPRGPASPAKTGIRPSSKVAAAPQAVVAQPQQEELHSLPRQRSSKSLTGRLIQPPSVVVNTAKKEDHGTAEGDVEIPSAEVEQDQELAVQETKRTSEIKVRANLMVMPALKGKGKSKDDAPAPHDQEAAQKGLDFSHPQPASSSSASSKSAYSHLPTSTHAHFRAKRKSAHQSQLQQLQQQLPQNLREEIYDDCTALTHLDELSILENLRKRYAQFQIYTSAAKVLLAVNPLTKGKEIDALYSDERKCLYQDNDTRLKQPPHPYGVADAAYRQMLHEGQSQVLIISGVSGAGKTETAKIAMGYLAYRSRSHEMEALQLAQKMLDVNPVLEAFGNAATVRNCNSSRFGKYNALLFNVVGHLQSAEIRAFLLESSRVTSYGQGERSYHAFYELLAACDEEFLADHGLYPTTKSYRLAKEEDIGRGAPHGVFKRDDAANFLSLQTGLQNVFPSEKGGVEPIFKLLCGLIHLAEIDIVNVEQNLASDALRLDNEASVEAAATILGLSVDKLTEVLTTKWVVIAGRDSYQVARTQPQAIGLLHSLSKFLYRKLFDYVVTNVNASLHGKDHSTKRNNSPNLSASLSPNDINPDLGIGTSNLPPHQQTIGILDIYGFEQLEANSFEQLCINLANEHLQQFFIDNVLLGEQELYSREGLKWTSIDVPQCGPCVSAIADCFRMLDDACFRVGRMSQKEVTAATYTQNVHVHFKTGERARQHGIVKEPKRGRGVTEVDSILKSEGFVITHFAGDITYHTAGWLEKNNSRLDAELEKVVALSSNSLVSKFVLEESDKFQASPRNLLADGSNLNREQIDVIGRANRKGANATLATFDSVSRKYLGDLQALITTLQEANLHYIRCFCPNAVQEPHFFDKPVVLNQMRESGTFQLVDIMHRGYPHRCDYKMLAAKFQSTIKLPDEYEAYDARTFIDLLMLVLEVPKCDYVMGISKLFLKSGKLAILQKLLADNASLQVSADLRRFFTKKKLKRCLLAVRFAVFLKTFIKKCRRENLEKGMVSAARTFVRLVRWRRRAQRRLKSESNVTTLVRGIRLQIELRKWLQRLLRRVRLWKAVLRFALLKPRMAAVVDRFRQRKIALREHRYRRWLQGSLLFAHVKKYVRRRVAQMRIRKQQLRQNVALLCGVLKAKIAFSRALSGIRKARKELAEQFLHLFFRRALLVSKFKQYVAGLRARIAEKHERASKAKRSEELLCAFWRISLLKLFLRRRSNTRRLIKQAAETRRAEIAKQNVSAFARHALLTVALKRLLQTARVSQQQRRVKRTRELVESFARGTLMFVHVRKFFRAAVAERRAIRRVRAQRYWDFFLRSVLFRVCLRLHIRDWRFNRALKLEQEKRRQKKLRVEALLQSLARGCLLAVHLRSFVNARRLGARRIFEFLKESGKSRENKKEALLSLVDAHRRKRKFARVNNVGSSFPPSLPRVDDIFCKIMHLRRLQLRWRAYRTARKRDEKDKRIQHFWRKFVQGALLVLHSKRYIRRRRYKRDLTRSFARAVFFSIRLRRWIRSMKETFFLRRVEDHVARVHTRTKFLQIVTGLVLFKRAVKAWVRKRRARRSGSTSLKTPAPESPLLQKFVAATRLFRLLRRWIKASRQITQQSLLVVARSCQSEAVVVEPAIKDDSLMKDNKKPDRASSLRVSSTVSTFISGNSAATSSSSTALLPSTESAIVSVGGPAEDERVIDHQSGGELVLANSAVNTNSDGTVVTMTAASFSQLVNRIGSLEQQVKSFNDQRERMESLEREVAKVPTLERQVKSLGSEVRRTNSRPAVLRDSKSVGEQSLRAAPGTAGPRSDRGDDHVSAVAQPGSSKGAASSSSSKRPDQAQQQPHSSSCSGRILVDLHGKNLVHRDQRGSTSVASRSRDAPIFTGGRENHVNTSRSRSRSKPLTGARLSDHQPGDSKNLNGNINPARMSVIRPSPYGGGGPNHLVTPMSAASSIKNRALLQHSKDNDKDHDILNLGRSSSLRIDPTGSLSGAARSSGALHQICEDDDASMQQRQKSFSSALPRASCRSRSRSKSGSLFGAANQRGPSVGEGEQDHAVENKENVEQVGKSLRKKSHPLQDLHIDMSEGVQQILHSSSTKNADTERGAQAALRNGSSPKNDSTASDVVAKGSERKPKDTSRSSSAAPNSNKMRLGHDSASKRITDNLRTGFGKKDPASPPMVSPDAFQKPPRPEPSSFNYNSALNKLNDVGGGNTNGASSSSSSSNAITPFVFPQDLSSFEDRVNSIANYEEEDGVLVHEETHYIRGDSFGTVSLRDHVLQQQQRRENMQRGKGNGGSK